MTSINHNNNLCLVTLSTSSSTPPSSSAASISSTSSNGWTQKISEKIQELKSKLKSLKNLKNAKNGYLTENDSKSLDSLPTQLTSLETVQKLAEFADQLDTKNNDSTNILNNLRTGLEKFLGFNSASKGYDGQGIVYSDLDRLCDAVMGFLSGVLDAVKDDDAVKTYDNYITDKNNRLEKVLDLLTSSIGSGRTGLAASVGAVREWLEGYEGMLNEKIRKVTATLELLAANIVDNISSVCALNNYNVDVPRWQQTVMGALDITMRQADCALLELDNSLQVRLKTDFETIHVRLHELSGSAARDEEELRQLGSMVSQRLDDLKNEITNEANASAHICINDLRAEFNTNIKTPIEEIKKSLSGVHANMANWITVARRFVAKAMDKVDLIVKKLDGKNGQERQNVTIKVAELTRKAHKLLAALSQAKITVEDRVGEVTAALKQFDADLRKDLFDAKDKIKQILLQLIQKAQKQFGTVKNGVVQANQGGIDYHWKDYKKIIKDLVEQLVGKQEDVVETKGILGDIAVCVGTYATKFVGGNGLGDRVSAWIQDILEKDFVVKEYIDTYIGSGDNRDKFIKDKVHTEGNSLYLKNPREIADVIKNAIRQENDINMKDAEIHVGDNGIVQGYIDAVHMCISEFANELDKKLNKEKVISMDTNTFIYRIVIAIEQIVVQDNHRSDTNKSFLRSAVAAILSALRSKARQVAEELKSFTTDARNTGCKLGKNVDDAIKKITRFGESLESDPVTTQIEMLRPKIEELESTLASITSKELAAALESHLPGIDNAVELEKIGNYRTHISNGYVTDYPYGHLNHAIREMEMSLNKNLDVRDDKTQDIITPGELQTSFELFKSTFSKFINPVKELVKKEGIISTNDHLESYLRKLDNMINDANINVIYDVDKCLESIRKDIENIIQPFEGAENPDNTLEVVAKEAKKFYSITIKQRIEKHVHTINETVIKQVMTTGNNLRSDVLTQCICRKAVELGELKALVEAQKYKIAKTLDENITKGINGFLITLRGAPPISHASNTNKLDALSSAVTDDVEKIQKVADKSKKYLDSIVSYVVNEVGRLRDLSASAEYVYPDKMNAIRNALYTLLEHIGENRHYEHKFSDFLYNFEKLLAGLNPHEFVAPACPLIDFLKYGLKKFTHELDNSYVNVYEGAAQIKWEDKNYNVTKDATKCAKVFLTLLNIVVEDLTTLNRITETYSKTDALCLRNVGQQGGIQSHNPLGDFFHQRGYKVPSNQNTQDGELRQNKHWNGKYINRMLLNDKLKNIDTIERHLQSCESNNHGRSYSFYLFDVFNCLLHHVEKYNEVCHLATFTATRSPCSVYEMLIWLSGLTHNRVQSAMVGQTFLELLKDPAKEAREAQAKGAISTAKGDDEEEEDETIEVSLVDPASISLDAYPKNIEFVRLGTTLTRICSIAYDIICTIVGTGDEYTTYGCDYSNNSFKLKYPSDPAACFDMLVDILRRLLPQLRYLYNRCRVNAENHGWGDCEYGRTTPTTKWPCKTHSSDKATCQPNCEANDQAKCQPTSPLMSYLNDCLPGHLPHKLSSIGCKYECLTCPSTSKLGMPCMTPLGFRAFSGSSKTGKDICEILRQFLGTGRLSSFLCLVPTPPKTLPEHFNFAVSLVREWEAIATRWYEKPIKKSIETVSIGLFSNPRELTDALRYVYGSSQNNHGAFHPNPSSADVSSLSMRKICTGIDEHCAPYIETVCSDSYAYLPYKHSDTYLSWAVYLPWTFWQLLNNLYNAFCNINCQDWGCRECLKGDKCKRGEHGLIKVVGKSKQPHCQCSSIVSCNGVSSTIYQYGFSFGDASMLNKNNSRKTCSDFCTQLKRVLDCSYFKTLFTRCDDFLFTIRQPFIWLNVALWSLSLFYLLHIMVIRLDLLHIKSHLHSPSSHRIAAQSLLAAGRVNKLNRVFYLQP